MKRIRLIMFVPALLAVIALTASASTAEPGYREIEAKDLKNMMDVGNPVVIFPLSSIEYNDLHIAGSHNIPLSGLDAGLPADKNRNLVFYCLGLKCTASWRAAEKAIELGYKNVFAFRKGLPAWVEAGYPTVSTAKLPDVEIVSISTDDLAGMLASGDDFVLLDVCLERDSEKFWIDTPNRIHVPFDDLERRLNDIPKDKRIAVICLKGKRSPTAIRFLTMKGYRDVVSVDGGMQKWILEGKPVKTRS